MKILPTPYRPVFETLLKTNATFTGPKLHNWIDSGINLNSTLLDRGTRRSLRLKKVDITSKVNEQSWEIVNLCGPPGHFLDSCTDSYWSTEYPDPKSELTPIKENGQIR